jgi:protein phosphatase
MAYDFIGDVHGCIDELTRLLNRLGYALQERADGSFDATPPPGRTLIFLGDLVNRGPDTPSVLRLVMSLVEAGTAIAIAGNHDVTLANALRGNPADKPENLVESLAQLQDEPDSFKRQAVGFIESLPRRLRLDDGRLIVAHAGLPLGYHDAEDSAEADKFAVFGRRVPDGNGQMVRYRWANDYEGEATVVYGHYSGLRAEWLNDTICIDTGCVYGGSLTALRYPERELVSVPAARIYYRSTRSEQFRAAAAELTGA